MGDYLSLMLPSPPAMFHDFLRDLYMEKNMSTRIKVTSYSS